MHSALTKIVCGQACLIGCCILYLIWWSMTYHPYKDSYGGVLNGILLLIMIVLGLSGVMLSIYGVNLAPKIGAPKWNGIWIILGGIAMYVVLLFVTNKWLHRPVTTELFLIIGWSVLELSVINSLNLSGNLSDMRFFIMTVVIAIAVIISLVLYVLYYRMGPRKAFYFAMVPLITEAVSMVILLFLTKIVT